MAVEVSLSKTLAAWEADGGEALAAQIDAALEKLVPKLIEALAKIESSDEDPVASAPH